MSMMKVLATMGSFDYTFSNKTMHNGYCKKLRSMLSEKGFFCVATSNKSFKSRGCLLAR
eukprot:UN16992